MIAPMSDTTLVSISNQLADAVAAIAPSVVQVQGRRRPASGVVYATDVVLTTVRALGREDKLRVRTHDARELDAELAGWDPASGLAVLRAAGLNISAVVVADRPALLEHGSAKRGYLGVAGQPVELTERQRGAEYREQALLIVAMTADTPADAAGLMVGDVMLDFDGHPVESPEDLLDLLVGDRVGKSVPVRLLRGGVAQTLTVRIGERKE